jgi:hypothetical protein
MLREQREVWIQLLALCAIVTSLECAAGVGFRKGIALEEDPTHLRINGGGTLSEISLIIDGEPFQVT